MSLRARKSSVRGKRHAPIPPFEDSLRTFRHSCRRPRARAPRAATPEEANAIGCGPSRDLSAEPAFELQFNLDNSWLAHDLRERFHRRLSGREDQHMP